VQSASFCENSQTWHVLCSVRYNYADQPNLVEYKEYIGRWLVVATGENAEVVRPHISGIESFKGTVIHSSEYKTGFEYEDKKVLVVGCGNSGMEIALDLVSYNAKPSLVVRSSIHVLPRQVLGKSTFGLAMKLMKVFPVRIVDSLLLLYSRLTLGNTASYGLRRPVEGPLELKSKTGKTPVLDVGTLTKIRTGDIKVYPSIEGITATGVQFQNGHAEEYDVIILATGYRSDVPRWLKDDGRLFSEVGLPTSPFPENWKAVGKKGLYAAGFSRRGLLGSSIDAQLIAGDIKNSYNNYINSPVKS
jgi:indole-3-pyruvate monooxygenase